MGGTHVGAAPGSAAAPLSLGELAPWLIVLAGLCFLYAPSYFDLFNGLWSSDEQIHGPIVLAISLWLMHRKWPHMLEVSEGCATSAAGWPVLVFGLLLYVLGRSQDILIFEIGSFIWVLAAVALLMRGRFTPAEVDKLAQSSTGVSPGYARTDILLELDPSRLEIETPCPDPYILV
jgi:hypothetical protein